MIKINKIPIFIAYTFLFFIDHLLHIDILAGKNLRIKERQAILNDSLTGYYRNLYTGRDSGSCRKMMENNDRVVNGCIMGG